MKNDTFDVGLGFLILGIIIGLLIALGIDAGVR